MELIVRSQTAESQTPDVKTIVRISISACFSLAALGLCVGYVFYATSFDRNLRLDNKVIALLVAALLPWVLGKVDTVKWGGVEIKAQLAAQDKAIDAQDKAIREQQKLVNLMFLFSMEKDMFDTLENLVKQSNFTHNPEDRVSYAIVSEQLKELFNRNYVDRDPKYISAGENIGNGSIVTALGRRYVQEREKLETSGDWAKLHDLPAPLG
jgi:hypothetical protein